MGNHNTVDFYGFIEIILVQRYMQSGLQDVVYNSMTEL